jgi:hypothetical protein
MATPRTFREEVVFPTTVEDAWALLSDTARMVRLDPLLVACSGSPP